MSAVRVEFHSDRMSYIMLMIMSQQHEIDYVKDSFYGELECVFYKLPKYHMKILLADFNAKVGRKNSFKQVLWNESLH
jgi:hypothetical protein